MKTRLLLAFLLVLTTVVGAAWATHDVDTPAPIEIETPAEADVPVEAAAPEAPAELPTLIPELTEANGGGCCEAACWNEQTACNIACGNDLSCKRACRQQFQVCRSFC
ncbi:MAG: hypothetical protein AAGE94_24245 [Acidobacteriota bacterium]